MLLSGSLPPSIDRYALVTRHNVELTAYDGERPLQVGNGEFAFGMDATGLQSFAPFNTMSQWGWRREPLPPGTRRSDYAMPTVETHGRRVPYPLPDPKHPEISDWLRKNPHRVNLGRVGFAFTKADGSLAIETDLRNVRQRLDLWTGLVTSRFEVEGRPVTVTTACHPSLDAVAAKVESPLIQEGRLAVFVDAPGDDVRQFANAVGDGGRSPGLTRLPPREGLPGREKGRADFVRKLPGDGPDTHVGLVWSGEASLGTPGKPLPLRIVKAEYGREGKWRDLTALVARSVREGRLSLHVDNALAGDPAPRELKSLRVSYVAGDKPGTTETAENGDLVVDPFPERRRFTLRPGSDVRAFSFVCAFAPKALPRRLPDAETTFAASRQSWPAYWRSGGAVDLSESQDPRWRELERRIVLSQYLMKVNEAGSQPPQESGLVNNGWFGRFHLEMVWWHATHWGLWNRWPQIERTRDFYARVLPQAQALARAQGYKGARWPKCIGPDGQEWPFETHAYLAWQQPHPIFFAELDYRAHPTSATLRRWAPIVEATADFLASYAFDDAARKRSVLGPPLQVVSENVDPLVAQNPTFELGYWRFGLRTALEWRKRRGQAPKAEWAKVLRDLAPLPQQDGLYVLHEGVRDMWSKFNFEHPALTGAYGMLPGDGVDRETMRRTLDKVTAVWDFNRTWGWDFPMLAMCAARLGEPERAMDFLLHPSGGFQFDERGLATGGPFPYFPSNGALLYAVAMMAAGWDGAPKTDAPGFPQNGRWKVRWEGLSPAP